MASLVLKEKCRNSGAGAAQSVPLAVRAPRSVARSCRVPCGLGSEPGDGGGGGNPRAARRGAAPGSQPAPLLRDRAVRTPGGIREAGKEERSARRGVRAARGSRRLLPARYPRG